MNERFKDRIFQSNKCAGSFAQTLKLPNLGPKGLLVDHVHIVDLEVVRLLYTVQPVN